MLEVIITKEELYDKCENVEQLYDGFYYPLLVEYKELKKQLEVLEQENQKYKEVIDKAIEYINKYAWQEDIIGGIYTTNGKPATDRYMKLEWDNCNELLDILNEVE